MAVFFNKTKGPLSFALPDGTPIVVPPKGRVMVAGSVPTSVEMKALLDRGTLMLLEDAQPKQPKSPVVGAPVVMPKQPVAPVTVAVATEPFIPKDADTFKGWSGRAKYKSDTKAKAAVSTPVAVPATPVAPEAVKVEATTIDTVVTPELTADSTDKTAAVPSDAE